MEYTKIKFTTYKKETGKLMEFRCYDSKLKPWGEDKILEYLYKKHPKLKKMNFTIEVTTKDFFIGRLVLNDI